MFRLPEKIKSHTINQKNGEFILKFDDYNQLTNALNLLNKEQIHIENMQILETDLESVFVRLMNEEKEN